MSTGMATSGRVRHHHRQPALRDALAANVPTWVAARAVEPHRLLSRRRRRDVPQHKGWTAAINPTNVLTAPAIGLATGALAGLIPAVRASRTPPAETLRG